MRALGFTGEAGLVQPLKIAIVAALMVGGSVTAAIVIPSSGPPTDEPAIDTEIRAPPNSPKHAKPDAASESAPSKSTTGFVEVGEDASAPEPGGDGSETSVIEGAFSEFNDEEEAELEAEEAEREAEEEEEEQKQEEKEDREDAREDRRDDRDDD